MHIASRAAALLLISARWPSRTTLAPLLTEGSEPASFAEELRRRKAHPRARENRAHHGSPSLREQGTSRKRA